MSIRYNDKNNVETICSGITPGGDLEYGAVATRSGSYSIGAVAAGGVGHVGIAFSDPMPGADYLVEFSCNSSRLNVVAIDKTINGFNLYWNNVSAYDDTGVVVDWTAFKLYEVADAEQLYSTVQDLETMIPANASSTNKFTTADDLRTESRALDRRLDDVEDVVPTSASITNKLVTQSDLSGVEIDKVEDINDVELTNIQDGQTLIWDDTNSKWVNGQGGKIYTAGDGINISNTDEISAKVDDTSITTDTNDALKVADTYKTIFVGTRAQWDALSTADKIKYNEAHITDDVIGGEVADVIQDGLMSPVTSNAVADELKISSYPLSSVTLSNITEGRATDDYIHMEKTGNMFKVILDGVIFTNTAAGMTIISNLPHPSSTFTYGKYGFLLDNVGTAFALLQVLPNGTLKVYGQKAANQQYWGEITYFID